MQGFGLAYRFTPTVQALFSVGFFVAGRLLHFLAPPPPPRPVEILQRRFASMPTKPAAA